jgi:hypothetical protein
MSWLGKIRSHRRDESWSASLWQTLFSTSMGAQIPVIAEKPLAVCGCRKFGIDTLGDHLCTCTGHSGAKKAHDWVVDQFTDLFRTTNIKHNRWLKAGSALWGHRTSGISGECGRPGVVSPGPPHHPRSFREFF